MAEKKKILVTDRLAHEALLTLQNQAFLEVRKTDTHEIAKLDLTDVHGLVIRSRSKISRDTLQRARKLQVIITATSGFDHIDLEACREWGVTVMFTPDANIESASQLTWALVLSCANRLLEAQKSVKSGEWRRDLLVGLELHRKTYGVVGLGRIGSRVAEIANAFGMDVIAFDPYQDDVRFSECSAERVAYEEVLKRSDILSFHVPATAETFQMLNRSHFEYLNRGLILVNTSRGTVISEPDLCAALENGWLMAAGLDVFEKEPLPRSSKLLQIPQVVVTPHIGANTTEAFAKASEQAVLKLIRFFMDGSTSDTLPPKAPWYGALPAFANKENI